MTTHPDFCLRWREACGRDASRIVLRDAAHAMIRARGLEDLNMRALAAEVGVTAMAAYRYYPSKDALVDDVRSAVRQSFSTCLHEVTQQRLAPMEGFAALCRAYVDYALTNRQDYLLMFGTIASPVATSYGSPNDASAWKILLDTLEPLTSSKGGSSLDDRAHLVWATLHGLVMLQFSGALILGRSIEQLLEPLVLFLLTTLESENLT